MHRFFSGQRGLSTEQVIESVLRGMEQGKKEFDIDYGVIVCAMRHEKEEANLQMLKLRESFLETVSVQRIWQEMKRHFRCRSL